VLESGEPNFPFCLGWANETWSAALWQGGAEREIIKEQTYPGTEDYDRHFEFLLRAFADLRYIRVESKPLLLIHKPTKIPDCRRALDYLRELAGKNGLPGLHIVGSLDYADRFWDAAGNGFDAVTVWPLSRIIGEAQPHLPGARLSRMLRRRGLSPLRKAVECLLPWNEKVYDYEQILDLLVTGPVGDLPFYQMAVPHLGYHPALWQAGGCFLELHTAGVQAASSAGSAADSKAACGEKNNFRQVLGTSGLREIILSRICDLAFNTFRF